MSISRRWTIEDLEKLEPKETERYELIDGELIVTHAPTWRHQYPISQIHIALGNWSRETGLGTTLEVPGLVFTAIDGVIPDLIWISWARLRASEDAAGHFTHGPELVVEVLSPGSENVRRDRETKLALYEREGVDEYWIVDWQRRTVDIFRRSNDELTLVDTLDGDAVLESPLLPGFSVAIARIWPPRPPVTLTTDPAGC